MIYAGVLYDTMYLSGFRISTSSHKYAGHANDCLYEKYKHFFFIFFVNIVLHFSSKVPGAPTKNVKTFFSLFFPPQFSHFS